MDPEEIRAALASPATVSENAFALLAGITRLVNQKPTHALGRELVIRALAVRDRLPEGYGGLLDALVRAVGLLPYADARLTTSLEDSLLVEAHRAPGLDEGLLFHTLQLQIYRDLIAGRNVVLSATTSVGKSLVVDAVISSGIHRQVAIIVPTIALIDETRRRLVKRFGDTHDVITHPSQVPSFDRPTIFVLTQERALGRDDLDGVRFFVVDEFYKLDLRSDDEERSVDLNLCFHKLASIGAQFYLIGPNISAVDGLAAKYAHVFIPSEFSTVALDVINFGLSKDGDARKEKLVELCAELTSPTLIYCQSPAKAAEAARALMDADLFPVKSETAQAVDWLRREYPDEWIVSQALERGIGIHHGNVPRAIQQYLVRAFDAGDIQFLVCTSTIIEGVNTVAENVILYDRRINTGTINYFTFRNIAGRAGRMNRYFIGKVFVLEEPPERTDVTVELPIDKQTEKTPWSLILDLPEDDLAPVSRERLAGLLFDSPLSLKTLRENRHVPLESQYAIARAIGDDLLLHEDALVWRGMPSWHQLRAVCELIYDHIDRGRTLSGYSISSAASLAAELTNVRMAKRFRDFIDQWLERRRGWDTVSNEVERVLRFLRKYVGYNFPRQLNAVSRIQAEIYLRAGYKRVGDYSFFAARAESLFMDSGLFALDEYGVPPETARRLGAGKPELVSLEDGLRLVASDEPLPELHPFERDLLSDVRSTLPRRFFAASE